MCMHRLHTRCHRCALRSRVLGLREHVPKDRPINFLRCLASRITKLASLGVSSALEIQMRFQLDWLLVDTEKDCSVIFNNR